MNALSEIGEILTAMKIPWQTGAYTEPAPDQYVVLVPLGDTFDIMADNRPQFDVQAVRLSSMALSARLRASGSGAYEAGCPFSPRGTTI